ncbi:hypothetical protein ATO6_20375 [Oceanicola sp. 22II-s10i]|uniref:flagellar biosynthesis regulator FlaF n=1 Tax=Oceanicola sp. 22II-s10i TaxID=1317116 RepID=UPI000B524CCA|nr:flagellar biosynthesis regulator FlaF [Oceanicola sp. 22II-s10i]OWU83198.1 hypothetical protein ATO6_20375 [Oceanicola sp. 22II-s10i]
MSIAAYKRTIRESESPRQIEARVFARITGDLNRHRDAFAAARSGEDRLALMADGLGRTLTENQKLWTLLRDDLASSGNQLPPQLRAQLLSIALWVERHTLKVLAGQASINALIDVNTHILAGLTRAQPKGVADGAQPHAQTV